MFWLTCISNVLVVVLFGSSVVCLEYLGWVGVTLLAYVMSGTHRWDARGLAMFRWMRSVEMVKRSSEKKEKKERAQQR
jgi:hypothetical protein